MASTSEEEEMSVDGGSSSEEEEETSSGGSPTPPPRQLPSRATRGLRMKQVRVDEIGDICKQIKRKKTKL